MILNFDYNVIILIFFNIEQIQFKLDVAFENSHLKVQVLKGEGLRLKPYSRQEKKDV